RIARVSPGILGAVVLKAAYGGVVARRAFAVGLRGRLEAGLLHEGTELCDGDFAHAKVKGATDPHSMLRLFVLLGEIIGVGSAHEEIPRGNINKHHADGIREPAFAIAL